MADNSTMGSTDNIATDDVTTLNGAGSTGVKVQRVKVAFGDDGTARDASASFPLPVYDPDTAASGTISATDAVVGTHAGDGVLKTGTPTANSYVVLPLGGGDSAWVLQLTGTFGSGTVWVEVSANSTNGIDGNWTTALGRQSGLVNTLLDDSITAAGLYRGNCSGMTYMRFRVTGATTPSIAVVARATGGTGAMFMNASLPAGTNSIGSVNLATSQGSAAAVTQTLSASATNTPGSAVTASTTGQAVANVASSGNVTFHLVTSAFVGTLTFEASLDGGLNYAPVMAVREDGTGAETTAAISTAAAFIRAYTVGLPGFNYFRVRASAFTSGTVAVYISQGPFLIEPNPALAASASQIGIVALTPTATNNVAAAGNTFRVRVNPTAITASTALVAAPGASLSIYVTDVSVSNAGATNNLVSIFDGASGIFDIFAAASGGGGVSNFRTPMKLTANTALNYTTSAASSTYVTVTGYYGA